MPRVTVIVPTLAAGAPLERCLAALARQTFRDFETIVVDNGGAVGVAAARVLRPGSNLGFGAAVNLAIAGSETELIAVLNDDAEPEPAWLEALTAAADRHGEAGMFASCVLLGDTGLLDSAGMLLCADGAGKQRGHREPPDRFAMEDEVLFPSGSAAMYRRAMVAEVGAFPDHFFLYGEDTDLGLRARWAGWSCIYVAGARVRHSYSESAGKASLLKAYHVERNRLFVAARNFPLGMLLRAPFVALARYWYHATGGEGAAAAHRASGGSAAGLAWTVLRAHCAAMAAIPRLLGERWALAARRRIAAGRFTSLARRFAISARDVARQ
ncbi:MAG: glycosyltransferase family 2 protein [Bryobacteraceae bacterium]